MTQNNTMQKEAVVNSTTETLKTSSLRVYKRVRYSRGIWFWLTKQLLLPYSMQVCRWDNRQNHIIPFKYFLYYNINRIYNK